MTGTSNIGSTYDQWKPTHCPVCCHLSPFIPCWIVSNNSINSWLIKFCQSHYQSFVNLIVRSNPTGIKFAYIYWRVWNSFLLVRIINMWDSRWSYKHSTYSLTSIIFGPIIYLASAGCLKENPKPLQQGTWFMCLLQSLSCHHIFYSTKLIFFVLFYRNDLYYHWLAQGRDKKEWKAGTTLAMIKCGRLPQFN